MSKIDLTDLEGSWLGFEPDIPGNPVGSRIVAAFGAAVAREAMEEAAETADDVNDVPPGRSFAGKAIRRRRDELFPPPDTKG
jgi:hypothetical protein